MESGRYRPEELKTFCREVFVRLGMAQEDAGVVADSLVRANLEGTDSHGVSRMSIYTTRMREGRISADPTVEIERDGSVLRVDGGNGLGQIASYHALKAALPVARETGIAGVGVRNSNHFGTAAYYCQMACREDMALIATTNSPPGIAPWGGKKAYFGTNPIAFGFPTRNEPPVIVDMSSSVVARGNIINAAREGDPIPESWATDEEGMATTDAEAALRGAVLPLGGAKGYALALAVEVMSGVLSGAAFGPQVNNLYKDNDPPANVGHSFILLDISSWLDLDDYYDRMDQLLDEIKATPRAKDVEEILYPGERRYATYRKRTKEGIALPAAVREELEASNKKGLHMGERLRDRRILVTQASTFMGPAVQDVFKSEGAQVIVDDRDLTLQDAASGLIQETGQIDVLIANLATVNPRTSATETREEDWQRMFDVMVHPLARLVKAVLPQMTERRKGKIVVMGSASALRGMPSWSAYSAARGAQLAFVRAVGVEVAPYNVQVNAVAQSFVENPSYFAPEYLKTTEFRERLKQVPVGRLATGREGALLALFLASDESDFFVGQVIPFAGGWVV